MSRVMPRRMPRGLVTYQECHEATRPRPTLIVEVEAIQGKIGRANNTRYLVKWKGHIERTLEPKSYLKGCMDLVQQYEDSLNKAKSSSKAKRVSVGRGLVAS